MQHLPYKRILCFFSTLFLTVSVLATETPTPSEQLPPTTPCDECDNGDRKTPYIFENKEQDVETQRLKFMQNALDPKSKEWLAGLIKPGSDCLEIGPGLGSMAKYIWEQTGNTGSLTVIDTNPDYLNAVLEQVPDAKLTAENIQNMTLAENQYDLIYARLVMLHLSPNSFQELINHIAKALKPGGYLVVEDIVEVDPSTRHPLASKEEVEYIRTGYRLLGSSMNFTIGYQLVDMFIKAGLTTTSETFAELTHGGSDAGMVMKLNLQQLKEHLSDIPKHEIIYPELIRKFQDKEYRWFDHTRILIKGQKASL